MIPQSVSRLSDRLESIFDRYPGDIIYRPYQNGKIAADRKTLEVHTSPNLNKKHARAQWFDGCQRETINIWAYEIYNHQDVSRRQWITRMHIILRGVDILNGRRVEASKKEQEAAWKKLKGHITGVPKFMHNVRRIQEKFDANFLRDTGESNWLPDEEERKGDEQQ